jgi:hypothetical protein
MGRDYNSKQYDTGFKSVVQVRLDGFLVERPFRNKGEAIAYLQKTEGLSKQDIARRVKFINS